MYDGSPSFVPKENDPPRSVVLDKPIDMAFARKAEPLLTLRSGALRVAGSVDTVGPVQHLRLSELSRLRWRARNCSEIRVPVTAGILLRRGPAHHQARQRKAALHFANRRRNIFAVSIARQAGHVGNQQSGASLTLNLSSTACFCASMCRSQKPV